MTLLTALLVATLTADSLQTIPQQSASLHGVVLKWGTSDPLPRAEVALRRIEAGAPAPYIATTGSDGRFGFDNVPPGEYRLAATRSGYVDGEYGQRRPNGPGLPIAIAAGQSVGDVQLVLIATGAISGRVYNRSGQPIGNVEVQALKASYQDGRRVLTSVRSTRSNDLGEYRLFWLPPGRYYVSATHSSADPASAFRIATGGPNGYNGSRSTGDTVASPPPRFGPEPAARERYLTLYFPGTPDEEAASPLDIGSGAEMAGVEIAVDPVRLQHVRGRIVYESTGEPALSAQLRWTSASGQAGNNPLPGDILFRNPVDSDTGMFDLALTPGSYTLVAAVNNLVGRTMVQVGYADIDNVTIPISGGFNISGRIIIDRGAAVAADLAALRVSLVPVPVVPALAPTSYSVPLASGSLTLSAGRGNFRVSVAPILTVGPPRPGPLLSMPSGLQNAYVKSIRLGSDDVLNTGLHFDAAPSAPLEIVIGTMPGVVSGAVLDANRQPAANVVVAVVPDLSRRHRTDLYKTAATDAAGRFRLDRVPPGDYLLFAWESVEDGAWYDPEFMSLYENRGTPVRVGEAATTNVDLVAIP